MKSFAEADAIIHKHYEMLSSLRGFFEVFQKHLEDVCLSTSFGFLQKEKDESQTLVQILGYVMKVSFVYQPTGFAKSTANIVFSFKNGDDEFIQFSSWEIDNLGNMKLVKENEDNKFSYHNVNDKGNVIHIIYNTIIARYDLKII